ncbi:ABC transporter ATP-binding protein [Swaminathania salitolerans]|uniref:Sugar ABC transporter ATP-binding protein n=1 Tax=Swaminathania salitolerans TaxID=182838 RepID=A0A511BSC4_9PROT|nr:ABC transporter ATP-binding protein [Swaminathania salitolerans]GBQ11502.1 O-antigen exporter ATP-binding protein [Swaminathania salitolerans LMG 21291]GEL02504.1 sugar ABC transporter ATP-binding protein [Swaminathania salitolerans]
MSRILVDRLSIDFPVYHADNRTLKRSMAAAVGGRTQKRAGSALIEDDRHRVTVSVLRDIGFSMQDGERLGLIGGNGAGKTTLLRALAGIYEPVSGRVRVEGTIGTLLDTQLGMNMELTGVENVRLRCLFHGLGRRASREVLEDVSQFAGLGDFMAMPVKTYSAGMLVRLAFGLATAITPDVLIMDEWFMAGDITFLAKAEKRLEALVARSDAMVMSSHQPEIMRQWCTRLIWLDNGRIRMDGSTGEVLDAYLAG